MATDLTIKKNLKSESSVSIILSLSFGGENDTAYSPVIDFVVPRAIKSMSALKKSDFTFSVGADTSESDTTPVTLQFSRYSANNDDSRLTVVLKTTENPKNIVAGESQIKFLISNNQSPLYSLNNKVCDVVKKGRLISGDSDSRITLKVAIEQNIIINPTSKKGLLVDYGSNSHRIQLYVDKKRGKFINADIAPVLQKGLISQNNVKDILVVAYKQWDKNLTDSIKRYYLTSSTKQNETWEVKEDPPSYQFAKDHFCKNNEQITNFSTRIFFRDGKKIAVYCTPVRYRLDKETNTWKGEWLQINKNKKVIWGRAESIG